MRLLLLLSALLSAVIGVGGPASAAPRQSCEMIVPVPALAARPAAPNTVNVPQKSAPLESVNFAGVSLHGAPVRRVPIYAERLRV